MDVKEEMKEIQELVDMLGSRHDREDLAKIYNFIKKQRAELEKKDKIIDEMAEWINKIDFTIFCNKEKCNDNCKQCVIEEFTKKVEGK